MLGPRHPLRRFNRREPTSHNHQRNNRGKAKGNGRSAQGRTGNLEPQEGRENAYEGQGIAAVLGSEELHESGWASGSFQSRAGLWVQYADSLWASRRRRTGATHQTGEWKCGQPKGVLLVCRGQGHCYERTQAAVVELAGRSVHLGCPPCSWDGIGFRLENAYPASVECAVTSRP